MATFSLPETTSLMFHTNDPLKTLQVNPKYQNFSLSNPNYQSLIQLIYKFCKQKSPRKEKSPSEPPPAPPPAESTIIHLVRPKSTQKIDLDSILKPKKSPTKKKKSQNSTNSLSINRSISSSNFRYPSTLIESPRKIFTPEWTANSSEIALPIQEEGNRDFNFSNIVHLHSRIEVFEHRIQMGEDENHLHPALAQIASESSENDSFSKIEKDKSTRYEEQKVIQKIPLFWPPRVYDEEENKMTEQESTQLEQKIQYEIDNVGKSRQEKKKKKIAKSHSIPISSLAPSQNKKKSSVLNGNVKRVGRPPKFSSVVPLNFDNYITDDEEFTDFDF